MCVALAVRACVCERGGHATVPNCLPLFTFTQIDLLAFFWPIPPTETFVYVSLK